MAGRVLPIRRAAPHRPPQQPAPPAAPAPVRGPPVIAPTWRTGDRVCWQGYTGTFLRETVDGQCEVLIGTRTYRVAAGELRSA
jgi:hypothetical protein